MAIPRLLHQTFSDPAVLHPRLAAAIAELRARNPGWQHRLYDNADRERFIQQHYGAAVLALYQRIDPAYGPARADFFRYLLVHERGGVYLDVKSMVEQPLDAVLREDDAYLLSRWDNAPGQSHAGWGLKPELGPEGEYQNWHVVAAPRHPYLQAVIKAVTWNLSHYTPERFGVGKAGVLRTTGPVPYTLAIEPIRQAHAHRVVAIRQLGFRFSVLEGKDGRAHEALFRGHYTHAMAPILRPAASGAPAALRVGRNDPCPCGSGRKFKKCHGA